MSAHQQLSEPVISADGTRIAMHRLGQGPGCPILLSNALGVGLSPLRRTLDPIAERHQVVTWDHRGLGSSGPSATDRLGADAHAEDALAVMDAAGIAQALVVAWSSGGRVALEIAHRAPERVTGLVLVCAGYGHSLGRLLRLELAPLLPRVAGAMKFVAGPLGEIIRRSAARPELAGLVRQSGLTAASVDTGALVELLRGLAEAETRVLLQTYEAVSGDPARGLLGSISAPTLIVAGDRDRFVPASLRQEMLERLPDARLEVFKDATHFLPLEHPQALAELIMSFAED